MEEAYRYSELAAPFEHLAIWGSAAVPIAGFLTAFAQGYDWLGLRTGWILTSFVLLLIGFALVPSVFLPRGRVFTREMAAARAAGQVTAGLRAAFQDRAVWAARNYELAMVAAVVALMVLKPF